MSHEKHVLRRFALLLASTCSLTASMPVVAAEAPAAASLAAAPSDPEPLPAPVNPLAANTDSAPADLQVPAASPSQNVTINLINRLVQRGVLTKEDSVELIHQAEADAVTARAQAAAVAQSAAAQVVASNIPDAASDSAVRVTYIPEVVKEQIRDDLRQEVMKQAYDEKWAAPQAFPSWVSRFTLNGDIRVRYQGDYFPTGNSTGLGSSFWNYNAINTGSPFDYTGYANPPINNVDQNRNRFRLRARFGAAVDLTDGFSAGIRIGTGENSSPVTQNQTLGASGGDFSKYAVWLDRGFIRYEWGGHPEKDLAITIGRFDNPFFGTKMIWADDIGFDGLAVKGQYEVLDGVTPFLTAGAFPVFNTDFNFASNQPTKFASHDKWLEAVQLGADLKVAKDFNAKLSAALYNFQNIQGEVSDPFTPLAASDVGSTDATRPSFAQRGNTYIAIRDIVPTKDNGFGTTNQWQYFGLATSFQELALTGRLDYNHFDPFHISLVGEAVKNLAFDRTAIEQNGPPRLKGPVNNNSANGGGFGGGDTGWFTNLTLGSAVLEKRWDWNVSIGYRYVESDAVVDGFCDSDFGGGGTNLKGYTLGGAVALSPRVSVGLRWMSADSIAGPQYKNDILQFEFNAKF